MTTGQTAPAHRRGSPTKVGRLGLLGLAALVPAVCCGAPLLLVAAIAGGALAIGGGVLAAGAVAAAGTAAWRARRRAGGRC